MAQNSRSEAENIAKVVSATSSEGFPVRSVTIHTPKLTADNHTVKFLTDSIFNTTQ